MQSVNMAIILGNVGVIKKGSYSNNKAWCYFSVATNNEWTTKTGEKKKETNWHNVMTFNKTAEFLGENLKKGSSVYVEGYLKTEVNEQDGKSRTTIYARSVNLF